MLELGQDANVDEWRVMCLAAEDFNDLIELYPDTEEKLKHIGLIKR